MSACPTSGPRRRAPSTIWLPRGPRREHPLEALNEPAEARQGRHMAWLQVNSGQLSAATSTVFAKFGRGFWLASEDVPLEDGCTLMQYVVQADIGELPASRSREVVARMVATYDPDLQMVVALVERGATSAYMIRRVAAGCDRSAERCLVRAPDRMLPLPGGSPSRGRRTEAA